MIFNKNFIIILKYVFKVIFTPLLKKVINDSIIQYFIKLFILHNFLRAIMIHINIIELVEQQ